MEINKIHNENCLATMQRMPNCFVDLVITSPPYDNLRKYKGYSFDFETIAKELFRITKNGGVVVWVVGDATIDGDETGTSFRQALFFKEIGFKLHDTMIYQKENIPLTHNRYEQAFEYMFVFVKNKLKTFNPIKEKTKHYGSLKKKNDGELTEAKKEKGKAARYRDEAMKINKFKIKNNIWQYAVGMHGTTSDKIAFEHPAIFPEKLAHDHIVSWSNPNDLIYDPFMGSGTVAKMAHLASRNWVGSEISKEYCDIANKRIQAYLSKNPLFTM